MQPKTKKKKEKKIQFFFQNATKAYEIKMEFIESHKFFDKKIYLFSPPPREERIK